MYLDLQKQEERFGLRFWRPNDNEKCITNAFNDKKLTNKLCVDYFEV